MLRIKRLTNYVRDNFDELAIVSSLGAIASKKGLFSLSTDESLVLTALRRSSNQFKEIPLDQIGRVIDDYSSEQMRGLINNVKGILFELEYLKIENNDDDNIIAYQFENTNHPGYDISLIDKETGDVVDELQLKATDDIPYVNEWIEKYGTDNIIVTDETAEMLGLESTGITNQGLEVRVEDFLGKLTSIDNASLETIVSNIGFISIAISVVGLARKWSIGEISREKFLEMATIMTGLKIIKLSCLLLALSIPGLQIVTAIVLTSSMILRGKGELEKF
ncbi:hypothetical protein PMIT1342_00852 [Prochlorococcus marinus str. MIT 1342]|uniref:hypothetical protein n=1 Tax=Prochlorococcus TaxID=1218 RepID=UPI0007B3AE79|nr:hypothetical protein [Prochlorococcus marinus]KZR82383.1 hypothetical protein PMIT1342_00852 [Prochlorococcus marinus str. MIT 1342]